MSQDETILNEVSVLVFSVRGQSPTPPDGLYDICAQLQKVSAFVHAYLFEEQIVYFEVHVAVDLCIKKSYSLILYKMFVSLEFQMIYLLWSGLLETDHIPHPRVITVFNF